MPEQTYEDLAYATRPDVYDPSDDTFLLLDAVRREPPGRFLEVGTGAGLVAIAAARAGHRVVATDRNPAALALARANARRNRATVGLALADLTRGLRSERFDLLAFNPPYLPTGDHERLPGALNLAFDGGTTGRVVLERFLAGLPEPAPPVLLVTSSHQDPAALEARFAQAAWQVGVLASRRFDDERLAVVRLRRASWKG